MLTVTIGDVKSGRVDTATTYRIYIIEGEGCVLYVGKSRCALSRMESHLCRGSWASFFGSNLDFVLVEPSSDNYTVTFYDEADVTASLEGHYGDIDSKVDCLEGHLIYDLSPVFNAMGRKKHRENSTKWYAMHPPPDIKMPIVDDLF